MSRGCHEALAITLVDDVRRLSGKISCRMPYASNCIKSAGIHKNWLFADGNARFQFRWEMHNAFSRANFYSPSTNIQSGSFGLATSADSGRAMLSGARVDF